MVHSKLLNVNIACVQLDAGQVVSNWFMSHFSLETAALLENDTEWNIQQPISSEPAHLRVEISFLRVF